MKTSFILLLLAVGIFVCGCQTPSNTTSNLPPPPTKLGSDAATIFFIRPTGAPAGVKGILSLDGHEMGKVFVRRYAVLNITPGRHEVRFSFSGLTAVPAQFATLNCEPGKKYYICYTTKMGIAGYVPTAPNVIFSISPNMRLLDEADAKNLMAEFDHVFTYGEIESESKGM